MTPAEIQVKANLARREMDYWQNLLQHKSCNDCTHFQQGGCQLANGQKPPEEVKSKGCDSWGWDSIPF